MVNLSKALQSQSLCEVTRNFEILLGIWKPILRFDRYPASIVRNLFSYPGHKQARPSANDISPRNLRHYYHQRMHFWADPCGLTLSLWQKFTSSPVGVSTVIALWQDVQGCAPLSFRYPNIFDIAPLSDRSQEKDVLQCRPSCLPRHGMRAIGRSWSSKQHYTSRGASGITRNKRVPNLTTTAWVMKLHPIPSGMLLELDALSLLSPMQSNHNNSHRACTWKPPWTSPVHLTGYFIVRIDVHRETRSGLETSNSSTEYTQTCKLPADMIYGGWKQYFGVSYLQC